MSSALAVNCASTISKPANSKLLLRNELPVLTGFDMNDRGTEDAVKRDDAGQVGAPQPPGITHPSFTVVAVKSLNGRIIIHG